MKIVSILLLIMWCFVTVADEVHEYVYAFTQAVSADILRDYELRPDRYNRDSMYKIALGYINESNTPQARLVLGKIIAQTNDARAFNKLGVCYWMEGKYQMAATQFKNAVEYGDSDAVLNLGNLYCFVLNDYGNLRLLVSDLAGLRNKLADNNRRHELVNVLIVASMNAGNDTEGYAIFTNAIGGLDNEFILGREDTACLVARGLEYFGRTNSAASFRVQLENKRKSIELEDDADRKDAAGDHIGAIHDYAKAIKAYPMSPVLFYNKGNIELHAQKYADAVLDYSAAISLAPTLMDAYRNRAGAKVKSDDFPGAIEDLTKAIELESNTPSLYVDRGRIHDALGEWQLALNDYRQAIKIDPRLTGLRLALWTINSKLGDRKEADRDIDAILRTGVDAESNKWQIDVAKYLTGRIPADQLLTMTNGYDMPGSERLCRMFYYIGVKNLVSGNTNESALYFTKAVNTGANLSQEYHSANLELMRR